MRRAPLLGFPLVGGGGAAALASVLLLAHPSAAQACSCLRIAPEVLREQADVILEGRVTDARREADGRVTAGIAVTRGIKGRTDRVVAVSTPANSAACGVDLLPGRTGEFLLKREGAGFATNLCLMQGARSR